MKKKVAQLVVSKELLIKKLGLDPGINIEGAFRETSDLVNGTVSFILTGGALPDFFEVPEGGRPVLAVPSDVIEREQS
jgi:hypothetical protein